MLTSGKYAFVVRCAGQDAENIHQQLSRKYGQAVILECHYSFRK